MAVSELVVSIGLVSAVEFSVITELDSSASGFAGISSKIVISTVSLSVELVFVVVISEVVVVSVLVSSSAGSLG